MFNVFPLAGFCLYRYYPEFGLSASTEVFFQVSFFVTSTALSIAFIEVIVANVIFQPEIRLSVGTSTK